MPFHAPVSEFAFLLQDIVPIAPVAATERFGDTSSPETISAVLSEAARLCDEIMAPLNRVGDTHPAVLKNGDVSLAPGFRDGYRRIAEGGWIGMAGHPDHGGMGLPFTVSTAVNDMMSGANMSLHLCPLLSQGQIEALEAHAPLWMQKLYLPKLTSGEWTGTMNLTEPQAGTDVGALKTKAERAPDGSYRITGQKIFITYGDHDFGGNVCHLVLARLPDAVAGPKGISLFMVPKFIPREDGGLGAKNNLGVIGLEHKLGIHASPTCVMEFRGAQGWLVGKEHDGMHCMFTMMNNARLLVGAQGIGLAEAAYQHAYEFALERKQGKAAPIANARGAIIDHADVRRMLASMKAEIFAARAIALACGVAIDLSNATGEQEQIARAAFLTPIAKAFGADVGLYVANEGVQIYGGMGFVEETGAAQFLRDVRITSIYEGTNGVQAMDLVSRKLSDGGLAAEALLDEITGFAQASAKHTHPELSQLVLDASQRLRETTRWLLAQNEMIQRFSGAVAYLRAFARLLGAYYHLRAATHAQGSAREKLARFYMEKLLPEHVFLCAQVRSGSETLVELGPEELQPTP